MANKTKTIDDSMVELPTKVEVKDEVKMLECPKCNVTVISFNLDEHMKECEGPDELPEEIHFDEYIVEQDNDELEEEEDEEQDEEQDDEQDENQKESLEYEIFIKMYEKVNFKKVCFCCLEHLRTSHKSGKFECEKCNKKFHYKNNLLLHQRIIHETGTDLLKCSLCDSCFLESKDLTEHITNIHLEEIQRASEAVSKESYVCEPCQKTFTRKYHLERHIRQTGCDGKPRPTLPCQICFKKFTRKDNLREHLRAHMGIVKRKKQFTCEICLKQFSSAHILEVHTRTHTGERPYHCDMCPKAFPSNGALTKHRRMHTGEKPYECSVCQRKFAAKETLNRHTRIHTGVKPHECTYCGKTFIQASQLRAHIFHHTGEHGYHCDYCGKAFNRRIRLVTHVRFVHEGATPYRCKLCKAKFVRKEDLSRHELLHSGEKPHKCPECDKCFAVKSSMKVHMLTHRKEEPRSCHRCGRAFIRQDCLVRHMRSKHRDLLEDIMSNAERKRLQSRLLEVTSSNETTLDEDKPQLWSDIRLVEQIKELLLLLVDEETLNTFGWPDSPIDKIMDAVIVRCGHKPVSDEKFDYIGRLRENIKLLFMTIIDEKSMKTVLNNHTVDEMIQHILKLAKTD